MIRETRMGYHTSESTRSFVLCAVVLALMSSFIAMVVSSVGLARSRQTLQEVNVPTNHHSPATKDRVWMIAIGDFGVNLEYLDEATYQIKGYNVDVVNAVCQLAKKTCMLTWDVNERCWDSQSGQQARGGDGLMSGWYDACTGWVKTPARSLTFDFTRAFVKRKDVALYVKNMSSVDYRDLSGLNVGFIDGWAADEHCLARYDGVEITGAKLSDNQIFHYPSGMNLIQALQSGEIDVAFAIKLPQLESDYRRITPSDFNNKCYLDGAGMMTRKSNAEFVTWWNEAWGRLVGTPAYDAICDRLKTEHGHKPGSDAKDVCIGY